MVWTGQARYFVAVTLLLLISLPVAAQQQEPIESERVRVRLLQLTLLALDRQDRPVTDLTAEEITVKVRGRKVPVAFLEPFVRTPQGTSTSIRLHLEVPGGSTDRNLTQHGEPRYVVVLIDVENGYPLERSKASEQLSELVNRELDAGTRIAVLAFDGELHLEQSFSSDAALVSQALTRSFGRHAGPGLDTRARIRDLTRRLTSCSRGDESCLRGVAQEYVDEVRPRAESFVSGLEQVTGFAAGLPRRVAVVALTHGVVSDPEIELREATRAIYGDGDEVAAVQMAVDPLDGTQRQREALVATALERGVTLHFIDRQPAPSGDVDASVGSPRASLARPLEVAWAAAQGELETLARRTGGMLVTSNNAGAAFQRVLQAERGAYLLGYYPADEAAPSKRSRLRVVTTRKGVRLLEGSPHGSPADNVRRLSAELNVGAGVPLAESEGSGEFIPFSLVLDPQDLEYALGTTEATADFTVHVRVETTLGVGLGEVFHFIRHAYARETWDTRDLEPLRIAGWTELPVGAYRVVALVRDSKTGRSAETVRTIEVQTR